METGAKNALPLALPFALPFRLLLIFEKVTRQQKVTQKVTRISSNFNALYQCYLCYLIKREILPNAGKGMKAMNPHKSFVRPEKVTNVTPAFSGTYEHGYTAGRHVSDPQSDAPKYLLGYADGVDARAKMA